MAQKAASRIENKEKWQSPIEAQSPIAGQSLRVAQSTTRVCALLGGFGLAWVTDLPPPPLPPS